MKRPAMQARSVFETGAFPLQVETRFNTKRGTLAYLDLHHPQLFEGHENTEAAQLVFSETAAHITSSIREDDIFSLQGRSFQILLGDSALAPKILREIARRISKPSITSSSRFSRVTPTIGYADFRAASTTGELHEMAQAALVHAKSSLEIEPVRYFHGLHTSRTRRRSFNPLRLWNGVPSWLALSIQFMISSFLGLGAPFLFYAACDALGFDISGPIYIGIVIVLCITALLIWIEGLLALKTTAPPPTPAKPYPPATVIIPAYLPNEENTIVETLNAFLKLEYPEPVQIIIAYNCPTSLPVEDELRRIAASKNHEGKFLIEPVRVVGSTSKAQNVNAVIGKVHGEFVGIFDADHHPRPNSLKRAWRWLSNGWDIVQGRCSIRNGADSWVSRMVAIEFEQIYSVSHPGRARLHGFGIFGGSNGFWRTDVLHETRMRHSMLTEDIDSSIRAVNEGHRIASDRHLISEELAPSSLRQLLNQRLRWAQGWFQVSLRRSIASLISPRVSVRQKLGLLHLLVWREFFPWYSIQVLPILTYWVWAYGWHYIHWAVPIFVATTLFTFSTGPLQVFLAYRLAERPLRHKASWFIQYFFFSTFFYAPFKDAISRIAHIKEAMRESAWRVTPRAPAPPRGPYNKRAFAHATVVALILLVFSAGQGRAEEANTNSGTGGYLHTLLGGEVATINSARRAAASGQNAVAAKLFAQAIEAVPSRRSELLREYADSLSYAGRSADAVPLYRELIRSADLSRSDRFAITDHLASALTWSNQFAAALTAYDKLAAQQPTNADVAVRRARVLASLERYADAVATLDNVAPGRWASGPNRQLGDEILVMAARDAAKTDQNALAAHLFDRAIRHNIALRPRLLREYADQLAFSRNAAAAIPLYEEAIANGGTSPVDRTTANLGLGQALLQTQRPKEAFKSFSAALGGAAPGTKAYVSAQRGISLSLTWSHAPGSALGAWDKYLKEDPRDTDAIIHKAQVLSTLNKSQDALKAYKTAYELDSKNVAAKRGLVDETINEARIDAQESKHAEAVDLFASAIALDPHRRPDLLREYADQLSFDHRASEAVPLYREVLTLKALSDLNRKRAMKGLADALAWADEPDQALAEYSQLVVSYPGDNSLRWTKLVFSARQAAKAGRNNDSATLFGQAIAVSSVSSASILREYADQLSFAGRSVDAVPVYLQALSDTNLAAIDKVSTQKGLAQAYDWSGRQVEAKAIYNGLIAQHPDDVSLQCDVLVVSAHEAAKLNRNEDAAVLFAKAIRLLPARRETLLREYADQLGFSGQAARSVPFYGEVIAQPNLSEADRFSAEKGLAQAYDWSNRPDLAETIFTSLSKQYPHDIGLRWGILVFSAHAAATRDQNQDAADLLARAIRLMPARRPLLLKEYADKLTFSSNVKDAIPVYEELIAQGGKPAEIRSAHLALALALAWDNQSDRALSEYQNLLDADPNDVKARDGLAKTLSWMGREEDAEAAYEEVLSRSPKDPEAQRGLAQVDDWQGHHREAQTILSRRIAEDPSDLEARRLLSQSLVWAGRPDEALKELRLALASAKVPPGATRTPSEGPKYEPADLRPAGTRAPVGLRSGMRSINDRAEN